ncbi:MAG: zf-HC2 domain-containing protein [Candidatus Rokubacteria bacterium]|nr:zf-HC2 domain-containing protein [Candidatus Rokubacteria bacterium]
MLRCRDIVDLLAKYLDEELDRATAGALDQHLAGCPPCTAFLNTYRGTVRTMRRLREEDIPAALRERLVSFLRQQTRS